MATYIDMLKAFSPPWLRGPWGDARSEVFGGQLDEQVERARQAVKARFPSTAPTDALPRLGADRIILRGPGESDESYIARLVAWRSAWKWAGTTKGLLQFGLAPTGLANTAVIRNRDWKPAPPDGNAGAHKRFHLVLAETHPWDDDGTWGDPGTYDNGTWGSTASVDDVARVRQIMAQWKPASARCVGIVVSFGNSTTITSFTATSFTFSDSAWNIVWDGVA